MEVIQEEVTIKKIDYEDEPIGFDTLNRRKGGNLSKSVIYNKVSRHAPDAIDVLVKEMKEGDNSNARVAAAKVILSKCIPDLKAVEVKDKDGNRLNVIVIPAELMGKYGIAVQTPPDTIGGGPRSNQISGS